MNIDASVYAKDLWLEGMRAWFAIPSPGQRTDFPAEALEVE